MKYQSIIIFLSFYVLAFSKDLSPMEKDKYLACNAITISKLEKDKSIVDKYLKKKDEFLAKGLRRILTLEMITKCLSVLTDEQANQIYKDLNVLQKEIDLEKINFDFDYSVLKEKNEFIFEPKYVELMKDLRTLVNEYEAKHKKEKESKSKEDKPKEDKPKEDKPKEDKPQGDL